MVLQGHNIQNHLLVLCCVQLHSMYRQQQSKHSEYKRRHHAITHLFSFELLEAVLPVLGELGLLALARLPQRRLDLHLPLATPARQAHTGLSIEQEEKKNWKSKSQ